MESDIYNNIRPRILHVDDERDFLDLFALTFGNAFDIVQAESVTQARKLLNSDCFDAVITDYEMPDGTGLEILKEVKRILPGVPVIFYTGQGDEKAAREAFISGAADYFSKKVDEFAHKEKMINSIQQAIAKHRVEKAYQITEKKYRFIYDTSIEMHVLIDGEFNVIDVNQRVIDMMKCPREQLIGRNLIDIVAEEDRQKAVQFIHRDLAGQKTPAAIFNIQTALGMRKVMTRENAVVFTDTSTKQPTALISCIDITDLEETKLNLSKHEELLQAITFGTHIAIVILDYNGNITYWNNEAAKLFKRPAEEVMGQQLHLTVLPKRYHSPYRLEFENFRKTDQKVFTGMTISLTALTRDEKEIPIELSLCSVQMENSWHAVGVIREMTKQHNTEEALLESKEQFQTLMNCVENSIFIVSYDGRLLSVNPFMEKRLGKSKSELLGKPFEPLIHPDDLPLAQEAFRKTLNGESLPPLELRALLVNEYRYAEVKLAPFIRNSYIVGVVGVAQEITDRKRAEEELKNINRELSDFAHTISHDLKGELAVMKGYLSLLRNSPSLRENCLEKLERKNQDLITFVDNLLKLSRSGKIIGENCEINLLTLIRAIYESEKDTSIPSRLNHPESLPVIQSDLERISQIFTNLIRNSFQHRDTKKEILEITIKHISDPKYHHLAITDNGSGINPTYISRIFNAGFSLGANKSSGFGLTIVKKIVQAHRGEIWAESLGEDQGTTIHIKFPIIPG